MGFRQHTRSRNFFSWTVASCLDLLGQLFGNLLVAMELKAWCVQNLYLLKLI